MAAYLVGQLSSSAPDAIRTHDTRFRRAVLYPLSYRGNDALLYTITRRVDTRWRPYDFSTRSMPMR